MNDTERLNRLRTEIGPDHIKLGAITALNKLNKTLLKDGRAHKMSTRRVTKELGAVMAQLQLLIGAYGIPNWEIMNAELLALRKIEREIKE